jgi:hypothetical protein
LPRGAVSARSKRAAASASRASACSIHRNGVALRMTNLPRRFGGADPFYGYDSGERASGACEAAHMHVHYLPGLGVIGKRGVLVSQAL